MFSLININKNLKNLINLGLVFVLLVGSFVYIGGDSAQATQHDESQTDEEKRELQLRLQKEMEELRQIEEQINQYKQESSGYDRDIAILEQEIRAIEIKIQINQLTINETDFAIQQNRNTIELLEQKTEKQRELLGKLILSIYKLDDTSSLEIILTSDTLSEFFNDVNHIKTLQASLNDTLEQIKLIKQDLEREQVAFEAKIQTHAGIINSQSVQRATLDQKTLEKEELLEASRTREYEQWILAQNKQKTIQEIRSQLFRLEGAGIDLSFGEAYEYAKVASSLTGIRPALLLSILKQESSWGKNVGLCFLYNKDNGYGIGVNTGTIYPRTLRASQRPGQALSDVEAFLQITQELGRDPYATRVSCWPQIYLSDGTPYGFGGAMGPAQFIPTTWLIYRGPVSDILGYSADPWRISDAFTASAYLLARNGATTHTYSAERKAALIYYAGGNWAASVNQFYGNQVMERAAQYQKDIDILEGN